MSFVPKPIVIVTGANSGVGFGVCQRLLYQLCEINPPDAQPQGFLFHSGDVTASKPTRYEGITLIMACRSMSRAEVARTKLYYLLDQHIEKLKHTAGYDGHAEKFREHVEIFTHQLDLGEIASIFKFSREISSKYPYISHLICNAGMASFSRVDHLLFFRQLGESLVNCATFPLFNLQRKGEVSGDGLGLVWQCNLFGHYVLFRSIQHLLNACPQISRVIWSSSVTALPEYYDPEDPQQLKTANSYENTKFQIDLIATCLDKRAESKQIRHFITHPGVCPTNISNELTNAISNVFLILLCYLARLLGSPYHTMTVLVAAVANVHIALVNIQFITFDGQNQPHRTRRYLGRLSSTMALGPYPVKFSAESGRWGGARVGLLRIAEWDRYESEGERLVDKCEALYMTFKSKETES